MFGSLHSNPDQEIEMIEKHDKLINSNLIQSSI